MYWFREIFWSSSFYFCLSGFFVLKLRCSVNDVIIAWELNYCFVSWNRDGRLFPAQWITFHSRFGVQSHLCCSDVLILVSVWNAVFRIFWNDGHSTVHYISVLFYWSVVTRKLFHNSVQISLPESVFSILLLRHCDGAGDVCRMHTELRSLSLCSFVC